MEIAMKMQKENGFTLIELMIVVAIIGILSTIAYPMYTDSVRRGKITEATSALSDARTKMTQFQLDSKAFDGSKGGVPPCTILPNTQDFTFVCVPAADTYVITANGLGVMAGFQYTINEANAKTSTTAGWGNGPTCWIRKRGGSC
jgi:type IV pilus assembly protein PilE